MSVFAINNAPVTVSALNYLRQKGNLDVIKKEIEGPDGVKRTRLCVSFRTQPGKEYAAQVVLLEEFPAFVQALREAKEASWPSASVDATYTPADEMLRQSLTMVSTSEEEGATPDAITFRTRSAKGAKPTLVPMQEAEGVISHLENAVPQIQAWHDAWLASQAEATSEPGPDSAE